MCALARCTARAPSNPCFPPHMLPTDPTPTVDRPITTSHSPVAKRMAVHNTSTPHNTHTHPTTSKYTHKRTNAPARASPPRPVPPHPPWPPPPTPLPGAPPTTCSAAAVASVYGDVGSVGWLAKQVEMGLGAGCCFFGGMMRHPRRRARSPRAATDDACKRASHPMQCERCVGLIGWAAHASPRGPCNPSGSIPSIDRSNRACPGP